MLAAMRRGLILGERIADGAGSCLLSAALSLSERRSSLIRPFPGASTANCAVQLVRR